LNTVNSPEGGTILYGIVNGAKDQAGGLTAMLRTVHNNCGEQPKIGQPFKFKGTNTVGIFFTVVNHAAGNKQIPRR